MPRKTGPLTRDELLEFWKSVVDEGYSAPLLEAGDGRGLELHAQGLEQLARVSQAVDRTFQSLFLLPHSGQTAEPATGARFSRVELLAERTARFELPLVLAPALFRAEHEEHDAGPDGPVPVRTGRRYGPVSLTVLAPGQASLSFEAAAERPGRGYDEPLPGTIRRIASPGAGLHNQGASVVPLASGYGLVAAAKPDAPFPDNVGLYVELANGANAGRVRRAIGYEPPSPPDVPANGGTLVLAATGIFRTSLLVGDFVPGEILEQFPSGAKGIFLCAADGRFVLDRTSGTFATSQSVEGETSQAQAVFSDVEESPDLLPEDGSCGWRVLDWELDLGLRVSNALPPEGGRSPTLDEAGFERGIRREPSEGEEEYRRRVASLPDTVSPNAILRTANRILGRAGQRACLREVGYPRLRGLFFDGDPSSDDPELAFAFDLSHEYQPSSRFRKAFDVAESRGFFLLGIPPLGLGDFGIAFDSGWANAYDAAPHLAFADGFPVSAAALRRQLWAAVDTARAYGVGFDLYEELLIDDCAGPGV